MKRNSFIFKRAFYESLRDLPRDVQGEILYAIVEYGLDGTKAEGLKPMASSVFALIKPILDRNNVLYTNGCKGGRKKASDETKTEPKPNQNLTKLEPNSNQNLTKLEPNSNQTRTKLEPKPNQEMINNQQLTDVCKYNEYNTVSESGKEEEKEKEEQERNEKKESDIKKIKAKKEQEEKEKEKEKEKYQKNPEKFDFKKSLIEIGVSEQVASDWLAVRKIKRAANTVTAFDDVKREIAKSGASADDCVKMAVQRSWQGFKAKWFQNPDRDETKTDSYGFFNSSVEHYDNSL